MIDDDQGENPYGKAGMLVGEAREVNTSLGAVLITRMDEKSIQIEVPDNTANGRIIRLISSLREGQGHETRVDKKNTTESLTTIVTQGRDLNSVVSLVLKKLGVSR